MSRIPTFSADEEEAGGREHFEDAALYDFEYRRRRADVTFYRRIAAERREGDPGPVLDLACGSGRLMVPLLRDGHTVVGLDRSPPMLARAAWRVRRLSAARRRRALLLAADLRAFAFAPRFALAICAFHSLQHLVSDRALLAFLRRVKASLVPGGWVAFDVLPPDPAWIGRDPARRWARTTFRHPVTRERLVYTTNHVYDPRRRALHMRIYYQPIDQRGRPTGAERVTRLCHRQLAPADIDKLLAAAGLEPLARFGGFDGRPLGGEDDDEHIYVARRPRAVERPFSRSSPTEKPPPRPHREKP
jgi:SAM-dependent methyltransferase